MSLLTLELEDDYSLIGIHSSEEDYRLAYLINKHLSTKLNRFKHNLDFENSKMEFPLFEYKDENSFVNYYLINNKFVQLVSNKKEGLFDGNYSTISYLIPEKKKVDYFFKIEGCNEPHFIQKLVAELNMIPQIITSYSIEPNQLKSKNHLIF